MRLGCADACDQSDGVSCGSAWMAVSSEMRDLALYVWKGDRLQSVGQLVPRPRFPTVEVTEISAQWLMLIPKEWSKEVLSQLWA